MRVVLSAALLAREHLVPLTRLLTDAAQGRHLVLCDDPDALDAWLGRQGELGALLREALDVAARAELGAPEEQLTVHLVAEGEDVGRAQPRLGPEAGFALCGEATVVWVEDNQNDRAFLLWLAGPELAANLRRLEAAGWLVFGHGGGSGLAGRVEEHCRAPVRGRRSLAVVDSDALDEAEGVGKKQRGVVRHLEAHLGERVWCLKRRMMENYLPPEAFRVAVEEGRLSEAFVRALRALGRRGWWLHLKRGLDGDRKRLQQEGREDPYADLDPETRAALARGYEDLGKLYLRAEGRGWIPDPEAVAEAAPHLRRLAAIL